MSKTPCRNRFSRFTAKVHLEDRIRELELCIYRTRMPANEEHDTIQRAARRVQLLARRSELERLLKHWKLEK